MAIYVTGSGITSGDINPAVNDAMILSSDTTCEESVRSWYDMLPGGVVL
jgi:hypothetical protein